MLRWQLVELLGEHQNLTGKKLTYREIESDTGLSKSLLSKMAQNKSKRVDFNTVDKLLVFFGRQLNRKLNIDDLLKRSDS